MNREWSSNVRAVGRDDANILVSVIIPSIQPDIELRRCVDSVHVAAGGDANVEVIVVVPPAQVPRTKSLVPSAYVIAESRAGIYAAMNDGARHSKGRYLYFLGKDDVLLSSFREALQVLETENPNALFCDVYWGNRGVHGGDPSRYLILRRNICHQGIIYGRSAFLKHGPYLRRMKLWADYLLNIKIIWDDALNVGYFPVPLAAYSLEGFSANKKDFLFEKLRPLIYRRYAGLVGCLVLQVLRRLGKI